MKNLKFFALNIFYLLILFMISYLSMISFSNESASSCLECSYFKDVLFLSSFVFIANILLIFLLNKMKISKFLFSILITLFILVFTFFNNLNIFQDRVSSWSSYDLSEEIISTLFQSYVYLIIGGIIIFFLNKKIYSILV